MIVNRILGSLGILVLVVTGFALTAGATLSVWGFASTYIRSIGLQSLVLMTLVGALTVRYRTFGRSLVRYLATNPVQAVFLIVTFMIVWGQFGTSFGIPELCWSDDPWRRWSVALTETLLLGLFGIVAFHLDPRQVETDCKVNRFMNRHGRHWPKIPGLHRLEPKGPAQGLSRFLRMARLPFLTLLGLPALVPMLFPDVPRSGPSPGGGHGYVTEDVPTFLWCLLLWLLGMIAGIFLIKIFLRISEVIYRLSRPMAEALEHAATEIKQAIRETGAWVGAEIVAAWGQVARAWREWTGEQPNPAIPARNRTRGANPTPPTPNGNDPRRFSGLFAFALSFGLVYWILSEGFSEELYLLGTKVSPGLSPGASIFALIGLFVTVSAVMNRLIPPIWRTPALAFVILWIAWSNRSDDKLQFDQMAYDPVSRVPLAETVSRLVYAPPGSAKPPAGLVGNADALEAWKTWVTRAEKTSGGAGRPAGLPKLVVVCVSGGGARSAVFCADVLERLDREVPGFHEHVRLMTGSSGGMLGAAHYVKWLHDLTEHSRTPEPYKLKTLRGQVPNDGLETYSRSVALREVWRTFSQGRATLVKDRGKVLEEGWPHLRQLPFAELRAGEAAGQLPSLVVAPFLLEHGRRFLVTNLDLQPAPSETKPANPPSGVAERLTLSQGSELLFGPDAFAASRERADLGFRRGVIDRIRSGHDLYPLGSSPIPELPEDSFQPYSLSALEYFPTFERDGGLLVSTATRMTATVPFVMPAVYLPSNPPTRVVDSAYYDDHGVNLAASWIFRNRDWLRKHTSGILVVQIRANRSRQVRLGVPTPEPGPLAWLGRGIQLFSSVLEGGGNAVRHSSIFRNDSELALLGQLFNEEGSDPARDFLVTATFESTVVVRNPRLANAGATWNPKGGAVLTDDAALWDTGSGVVSWSLSRTEIESIRAAIPETPPDVDSTKLAEAIRSATDPTLRAVLTCLQERARNYENLRALTDWWSQPQGARAEPTRKEAAR